MTRARADGGFTLFELLVVIAIMALVAAAVLPQLPAHTAAANFGGQVREIAARLRVARLNAVETSVMTSAEVDLNEKSVLVTGKRIVFTPDTAITVRTARELVVAGKANIAFVPLGGSTGGSITFRQGRHELSINVSWLTGAVSLRDGTLP